MSNILKNLSVIDSDTLKSMNDRDIGLLLMSEDEETIEKMTKIASDAGFTIKFPNLVEYQCEVGKNWKWINQKPKHDPKQGFFY